MRTFFGNGFVSSARLERLGAHEHFSVWVRNALVGSLVLGDGDGEVFARLLGLVEGPGVSVLEDLVESEPPSAISWAPRVGDSPLDELALAVQVAERPTIKQWQWRCEHGGLLRDHTGTVYEPKCGCRARTRVDHVLGQLASQLHAELARGFAEQLVADHSPETCPMCVAVARLLREHVEVRP